MGRKHVSQNFPSFKTGTKNASFGRKLRRKAFFVLYCTTSEGLDIYEGEEIQDFFVEFGLSSCPINILEGKKSWQNKFQVFVQM